MTRLEYEALRRDIPMHRLHKLAANLLSTECPPEVTNKECGNYDDCLSCWLGEHVEDNKDE